MPSRNAARVPVDRRSGKRVAMTYRIPAFRTTFALLCTAHALAQDPPDATDDLLAPPHISLVEGAATLDRDGTIVSADAGLILAIV